MIENFISYQNLSILIQIWIPIDKFQMVSENFILKQEETHLFFYIIEEEKKFYFGLLYFIIYSMFYSYGFPRMVFVLENEKPSIGDDFFFGDSCVGVASLQWSVCVRVCL